MTDIILLILIGIGLVMGFRSGIVRQVGSIVAFLAAVVASLLFGDEVASLACSMVGQDASAEVRLGADLVGRLLLFVVVWAGLSFVTHTLHAMIKIVHLGIINSLAGALFMGLKVAVALSVAINVWQALRPSSAMFKNGGPVTSSVEALAPAILGAALEG